MGGMDRRAFLALLAGSAASLYLPGTASAAGREGPNFVLILGDDWGWGDVGRYGSPYARTPNLSGLALNGVLLTQFYVSSPVCSPTRAALMTGQSPARHRVFGHFDRPAYNERRGMPDFLDPGVHTLPRLLQGAGYATGHFGKWHLGGGAGVSAPSPARYGIDEHSVAAGSGPSFRAGGGGRAADSRNIVDCAIEFIRAHRRQPFFVNLWLTAPHAPLDPTERQLQPYEVLRPTGAVGEKYKGALAIYHAAITDADRHVGRLLDELDKLELAHNTIVIFTSDNGPEDIHIRNASHCAAGSPGPFRGRKRSLYEGGIRVPFIVRWPAGGSGPNIVDDRTVMADVDLLPTLCSLAGVELPEDLEPDGRDLSPVFRGNSMIREKPLMWEWRFGNRGHPINKSPMLAIRDGRWKLLMNPDRSRIELYDLRRDPMEVDDRAAENPAVVQRLTGTLLEWWHALPEGPVPSWAGSDAYDWPGDSGPPGR